MKSKCSPRIWKKFSAFEKQAWLVFFQAFRWDSLLPESVKVNKVQMEVIAHNMACQAVWNLHRVFRKICKKDQQA